jgi:hypothetical protein
LIPDRNLVEASLHGDVRAFSTLVERYRYAVFGLCLNYTRDFDAAEDTAQEAFVKAFLKLPELADPERFAPWSDKLRSTNAICVAAPTSGASKRSYGGKTGDSICIAGGRSGHQRNQT